MGTSRDLRRGTGRGDRGPEGAGRRRNDPGPRRPRVRQVADPPWPRRRISADDGPNCYRRGPQPIRRTGRALEAGRRRRGALLDRSPRADPRAEAISHAGAVTDHAQRRTNAARLTSAEALWRWPRAASGVEDGLPRPEVDPAEPPAERSTRHGVAGQCSYAMRPPDPADGGDRTHVLDQHPV